MRTLIVVHNSAKNKYLNVLQLVDAADESVECNILNDVDIYVIPVSNPDGYEYTWASVSIYLCYEGISHVKKTTINKLRVIYQTFFQTDKLACFLESFWNEKQTSLPVFFGMFFANLLGKEIFSRMHNN